MYGQVQRRPLPSDVRMHRDSIDKLSNASQYESPVRAVALERLASSANRFSDVAASEAVELARYLLGIQETPEIVALEKHAMKFRHWANLSLALADEIPHGEVSIDHAMTVANLVTGVKGGLDDPAKWRQSLPQEILQRVALGLQRTAEVRGNDKNFQWDALREYMIELLQIRCAAYSIDASQAVEAERPGQLWKLMTANEATGVESRLGQLKTIGFLAENELEETVLYGQSLVRSLAERAQKQPRMAVRAQQIQATHSQRQRAAVSVTEQLWLNEIALYQLWSISQLESFE